MVGLFARGAAVIAIGTVVAMLSLSSARADAPPAGEIGSFPSWSLQHSTTTGQTYNGSATFANSAAFPATTWTTNSSTAQTPSGQSAFLGASTGFGQYFGSSRAQPYLYLAPAASGPSTTTITFASAPPPGWGFAVGDIDADFVEIIPRDSMDNPLPPTDLGAQDTGGTPLLNYCNNSPKPSGCTGPGPFTDFPTWHPNGATVAGTPYSTPIVLGSGSDTLGAYDWFLPGTDVRSLTFVFHAQSGFPIYQLWLAALAPTATITGSVVPAAGGTVPDGTVTTLEHDNGSPVLDLQAEPVMEPVAPDGSFAFTAEQGTYDLAFTVPTGDEPIPTEQVVADAPTVTALPVTLSADPVLPTTGVDASGGIVLGSSLALLGGALLLVRRRSRRRVSAR